MLNAIFSNEARHEDYMGDYVNNTIKNDKCGVILICKRS